MPRKRPVEYSILYTATLCLLAGGAVMVYSASSAESLLAGSGDPSYYLKRYVMFGLAGLVLLHLASRHGLRVIRALTPILLVASFVLTFAVMLPGVGVTVNGATRWLGAGPLQFQPSEMLKVALVLYAAQLLAARPHSVKTIGTMAKPLLIVVGAACALLMKQPDMGTTMVICFAIGALLVAAGTPMRNIGLIFGTLAFLATILAIAEPYRRGRVLRSRPRRVGAEDLLPARGAHGHDPGDHRRGARAVRDPRADRPLRDDRLRRPPGGEAGGRPVLEAARRRDHVADPVPGDAQLLRGARPHAADWRAAAVHLVRREQPGGADGSDGA